MINPNTDSNVPTVGGNESGYQPPASPGTQIEVDDSMTTAAYANFCRLAGLPEELLLDFGLNSQSTVSTQSVVFRQRVVTSWHSAKRLLHVLRLAIQRHEAAFGVLETDVQKRIRHA